VSSSLQRVLAMLEAMVFAAEDRVANAPAPAVAPAPPARRPLVVLTRTPFPLLGRTASADCRVEPGAKT